MAATQQAPNPRASLLSGLRTGGVRSTSGPMANVPHTAAPGGGFQVPRFASNAQHYSAFPEEDEDGIAELHSQRFANNGANRPLTAAVDGPNNRFSQQQTRMNANTPAFVPGFNTAAQTPANQAQAQAQAMQDMQILQMELLRLQVCDFLYRYIMHIKLTSHMKRMLRLNSIRALKPTTTLLNCFGNRWHKLSSRSSRTGVLALASIHLLLPGLSTVHSTFVLLR